MLIFEFDHAKSQSKLAKHGIDFVDARALWNDPAAIEVPAKLKDEPRFMVIGQIGGKYWPSIVAYREASVRIISVRRSRAEEMAIYESQRI